MRSLLIVAALAVVAPAEAHAESWYRIGGNEGTTSYVDLDAMREVGGKIVSVSESVYKTPLDGNVYATRIRSEYDCSGGYFRTLEYTYYDANGGSLGTEPSETINEHKVPVKDSINEAMMDFVCYRRGGEPVGNIFADARDQFAQY